MKILLRYLAKLCQFIGIKKVNMACDWVWFQEEEDESLKKYKNH